jgi:tetratricopeptide (TPR) repeat protein
MTSSTASHRHTTKSKGLITFVLGMLMVAAVGLVVAIHPENSANQSLIPELSGTRIGGGRFFRAQAGPFDPTRHRKALAKAELSVLSMPDSAVKQRIQSLIDSSDGRLHEAARALQTLSESEPGNAELLNDLGVIYLALGTEDASNYFKALTLFERAEKVLPHAPAPRFNSVVAYRRTGFRDLETAELQHYKEREMNSYWNRELSLEAPTDSQLMSSLQDKLSRKDVPGAQALIRQYADSYRTIAIEHALTPSNKDASNEVCEFILNILKDSSRDRTIAALLDPLSGANRGKVMQGRALVKEGIRAFQQFRFKDSSQFYDLAEAAIKDSGSLFDELWIALNRTDIEIRSVNFRSASAIEDVIIRARQANLLWLLGQALTSKASNVVFTENFDGAVRMLDDAITTFTSAGTPRHAVRAMSYLAIAHATAGDFETGLQIACDALRMTQPDDHVRLVGLYYVASLQLYRLGFERYAIQLAKVGLIEARATKNPSLIATAAINLATFYVANQEYASAEESVAETRDTLNQIEPPAGRATGELMNNLLCGRIKIGTWALARNVWPAISRF